MSSRKSGRSPCNRAIRSSHARFQSKKNWIEALLGRADALPGGRCVGDGDSNRMRSPAWLRHIGQTFRPLRIRACVAGLAIVLSYGVLVETPAVAQTTTIWSMLGIPNAQQSTNPAIQAAAKAKAAKHQIHKKKSALKYLAGIGCTPEHPEVMPALMAAMDDPDEMVRYEAVNAVLETAEVCQSREQKKAVRKTKGFCESCGDLKQNCEKKVCEAIERLCGKAPPKEHKHHLKNAFNKMLGKDCVDPAKEDCPCAERRGACCSPDMRDKLMKLAYGRDDLGCFLEPSKRVRDLAELAFNACNACACGCEGTTDGGAAGDHAVRELPAEDGVRETGPSGPTPLPLDAPCFEDRLLEPSQPEDHELVPKPVPQSAPESIPPPAATTQTAVRSVLVKTPAPAQSVAAAPVQAQAPVQVQAAAAAPATPAPLAMAAPEGVLRVPPPDVPQAAAAGVAGADEALAERRQAAPASHMEFQPIGGDRSNGQGDAGPLNPLRVPRQNLLRQTPDWRPAGVTPAAAIPSPVAGDAVPQAPVEPQQPIAAPVEPPSKVPQQSRARYGFSRRTWSGGSSSNEAAPRQLVPGLDTP